MKKNLIRTIFTFILLTPLVASAQLTDTFTDTTSSCINIQTNLKKGMTNSDVTLLQTFLVDKNYLTVDPTGYFGTLTVQAVKDFQSANNITPLGQVGPLTRNTIKTLTCTSEQLAISSQQTGNTNPVTGTTNSTSNTSNPATPAHALCNNSSPNLCTVGTSLYPTINSSGILTTYGWYCQVGTDTTTRSNYCSTNLTSNPSSSISGTYTSANVTSGGVTSGATSANVASVATSVTNGSLISNGTTNITVNTERDLCAEQGLHNIDETNFNTNWNVAPLANYGANDPRSYDYVMRSGESYSFPILPSNRNINAGYFARYPYANPYGPEPIYIAKISDKKCDFVKEKKLITIPIWTGTTTITRTQMTPDPCLGTSGPEDSIYFWNTAFAPKGAMAEGLKATACNLDPNKKYYLNVRWDNKDDICLDSKCFIGWFWQGEMTAMPKLPRP